LFKETKMVWAVAEDAAATRTRGVENFMLTLVACPMLVWMLMSKIEQVAHMLYTPRPPAVVNIQTQDQGREDYQALRCNKNASTIELQQRHLYPRPGLQFRQAPKIDI
jgi:hypothetical protein